MKGMALKELCEVDVEEKSNIKFNLPLKKDPLELMELPDPIPGPGQTLCLAQEFRWAGKIFGW